jgi:tetratricopeptide (TPR) repeat protein
MEETTQVRHLLAALNLEMENYTNAEMQYRAVIRLDAEDGLAYKGLITAFERQSKQEEGIAAVMQLKEQTGAVQPVLVLSEFYGRNGDFVQAFSLLEELEEPRSVQTTRLLQSLYLAKANRQLIDKNFDQGRKTILEGLTSDPDDPRLLGLLINIELLTEQFGEAAKLLAQLEKIIPDTPIVAVLSGDLAIANENFALAYKQYLLAWEVTTTDQVALKIFRSLSKHAVDKVKLIAFFEEWAEKVPDQRVSELTKAGYYLQEGEMDSAKIPYEALIEKFDDLYLAHNNLAWVYGEKELKKALASGKRAYELAPENPEVIDTYAWFLYKNSDLEQAKELLVKAVDLAPDHEEIAQHLDEVLSKI